MTVTKTSKNNNNSGRSAGFKAVTVTPQMSCFGVANPMQSRDPEVPATPRRRTFPLDYKRRIVAEAASCRGTGQIGALLRREGLYASHLVDWRKQLAVAPKRRGRKPMDPALAAQIEINRKLQKEKARLERRLAQAEVIIDVQKKLSELLGIPLNPPENEEND